MLSKMRLFLVLAVLGVVAIGCSTSDTPNSPNSTDKLATAVVRGEFTDGTFDYEFVSEAPGGANDPAAGSFLVRIKDLTYEADGGILHFDMWLVNDSADSYPAPVKLTFMQLMPGTVTVANADNGETGPGAVFELAFADSDLVWSPNEVSLKRAVQLQVPPNTSVSFVSKVEIGEEAPTVGGTIGGTVYKDLNGDGMRDANEEGVPGVGIILNAGAEADSLMMMMDTRTDSLGQYSFGALDAGHYTVMVRDRREMTTAPVLHVLLVDFNGEVADFLTADFGIMSSDDTPDTLMVGSCVNAKGAFMTEPDRLQSEVFNYDVCDSSGYCEDDDHMFGDDDDDDPMYGDDECWGRLAGPITDIDLENRALQVMGTWISFADWDYPMTATVNGEDHDYELGMRVRVDVRLEATDEGDSLVACHIHFWRGHGDRVRGVVQEILRNDDGVITGVRVLNTLVTMPQKPRD